MKQLETSSQNRKAKNYLGSTLLFFGIFSSATLAGIFILLSIPLSFNLAYFFSKIWCHSVLWMAQVCCGIRYEVQGLENISKDKAAIVLCNHQSAWETLALRHILPTQVVLLKRSLVWLPIWGWALGSLKSIIIDRDQQTVALRALLEKGSTALKAGLWVIVFPEGTRTAAGEVKKFSAGGAMLAQKTGFPVIPIAHNAGDYWPRYSFMKYPGTIKVKIGPAIQSEGRKAADINAEAEKWITEALELT
jgi:1-acyl-sn-glycerol-3-phosphate acyltransferase